MKTSFQLNIDKYLAKFLQMYTGLCRTTVTLYAMKTIINVTLLRSQRLICKMNG